MSDLTFAAYIPVVPSAHTEAPAPTQVDDFHPGVIAVLLGLVIGMVILSRGGR